MSVIAPSHPRELGSGRPSRVLRTRWVLLALALAVLLGVELSAALRSPGQVIRGELKATAAELERPRAAANDRLLRRLHDHFPRREVSVDARFWPLVLLTLHDVDRDTCRDAAMAAHRIEGLVVIELQDYRAAGDCRAANDMTWRLMP